MLHDSRIFLERKAFSQSGAGHCSENVSACSDVLRQRVVSLAQRKTHLKYSNSILENVLTHQFQTVLSVPNILKNKYVPLRDKVFSYYAAMIKKKIKIRVLL